MYVIPPLTISTSLLTSSTAVEVAPALYSGAPTYALDDTVSVAGSAGLMTVYKSLAGGNQAHTPASSPDWWQDIGDTYQAYSGAATYAAGDRVNDNTDHFVYESLVAGNIGQALTDATKWLEIGKTNTKAMFDLLRDTATIVPVPLTVVITPGVRIDSIAFLGMSATSVQIDMTSDAVNVYSAAINLDTRQVASWYDYFFAAFTTKPSLALFDLPPYSNGVITITITNTQGDVRCGACVLGSKVYLGSVQYEAENDVLNFSTVTRDFAGGTNVMVQRRNVPKTIQQIYLDKGLVDGARVLRDSLNGTPAVWSGLDDNASEYFEALLILGFYKRFSINLRYPTTAVISLELEEI